jgi:heparin binding hemagglutinin HbhA
MAKTISTAKANPIRPLYAAVGGVDVAVAKARTGLTDVQMRLNDVQTRLNDVQTRLSKVDVEPKALVGQGRTLVVARVDELQKVANTLPARVEAKINELVAELGGTVDDLNKQYVELAVRGRDLVARIRRQQATQDLKAEVKKTTTRAKTTTTQAKKTASTAKSSAKATGTSAKKAAGAAKKAVEDAADKTGA